MTEKHKSAPLSEQLREPVVDVLHSFRVGTWSILHVATHQSDDAFFFFDKDPSSARYVALWGGAAAKAEEHSIEKWALKNAPGIPGQLARCFAWYVTSGRDQ